MFGDSWRLRGGKPVASRLSVSRSVALTRRGFWLSQAPSPAAAWKVSLRTGSGTAPPGSLCPPRLPSGGRRRSPNPRRPCTRARGASGTHRAGAPRPAARFRRRPRGSGSSPRLGVVALAVAHHVVRARHPHFDDPQAGAPFGGRGLVAEQVLRAQELAQVVEETVEFLRARGEKDAAAGHVGEVDEDVLAAHAAAALAGDGPHDEREDGHLGFLGGAQGVVVGLLAAGVGAGGPQPP